MMFNVDHVRRRKPWVSVVMFVYLEVKDGKGAFSQTERKFRGSWLFRGRWLQEVKGQDAIQQP